MLIGHQTMKNMLDGLGTGRNVTRARDEPRRRRELPETARRSAVIPGRLRRAIDPRYLNLWVITKSLSEPWSWQSLHIPNDFPSSAMPFIVMTFMRSGEAFT